MTAVAAIRDLAAALDLSTVGSVFNAVRVLKAHYWEKMDFQVNMGNAGGISVPRHARKSIADLNKDTENKANLASFKKRWYEKIRMSKGDINIKMTKIAERFAAKVRKKLGPRLHSVVLFGSVARGEATCLSDIDLLIIAEGLPAGRYVRQIVLDDILDEEIYRRINCHLKTREEASHIGVCYFDMVQEAKLLYDRNGFFREILLKTREKIASLGAKRRRLGRFRYWDLKPDYKDGDIFSL